MRSSLLGRILLDQDNLKVVAKLRRDGKLAEAEAVLLRAEPTPAALDELRKLASTRAHIAKQAGDWRAVIKHLEGYTAYADRWRSWCLDNVKQASPKHAPKDRELLEEAKSKI